MRVLVTGSKGQLGYDVINELKAQSIEAIGYDKEEMDITNAEQVRNRIIESKIDAVIHCAAYTAVDLAEENNEICELINVQGTKNIATVCQEQSITMIYISTDYVFDGTGNIPWEPDSTRNPINYYGYTKSEGESIVESLVSKRFIVRISWVFGENGKNFVSTMLKLAKQHQELKVVNDQYGSPTYTKDLSVMLVNLLSTDKYGTYHATNEGYCTWYEFALEIFKNVGYDTNVVPVDSGAFPVKAKRPYNSMMNKDKLIKMGFSKLPSWQDALKRYLKSIDIEKI